MLNKPFFTPDWELPNNVRALCTTRQGGLSTEPFDTFNLAVHVGDYFETVQQNRKLLIEIAGLPTQPVWLDQQHTDIAIELTSIKQHESVDVADASWTSTAKMVPVVMTADCLPVLVASKDGKAVAAIHAGWKGLAKNIISKTIKKMGVAPQDLTAWIGPAISAKHFEVGKDVYDIFVNLDANNSHFFSSHPNNQDKYLADLPAIAAAEMQRIGLLDVQLSQLCSYENSDQFYSYRRDGQTGRMASLIWLE